MERFNFRWGMNESCFVSQAMTERNVSGQHIFALLDFFYVFDLSYNGKTYVNHPDTINEHYLTSLGNIDNKVLAVGGNSNNQVEIFDISNGLWTAKSSFKFCTFKLVEA